MNQVTGNTGLMNGLSKLGLSRAGSSPADHGAGTTATGLCRRAFASGRLTQPGPRSPRQSPPCHPQRGFSLLEMIAAMLLLAIAFTALMKVAGASISLTQNAAQHSEAALWARGKLDSAFVGEPIRAGQSAGAFNDRFRWQLSVTPWTGAGVSPPNAALRLYQLDLEVLWGPSTHPRSAHFRTLRVAGSDAFGKRFSPARGAL